MTGPVLRLDSADLLRALTGIDLVGLVVDGLVNGGVDPSCALVPSADATQTVVEHIRSGRRCLMPTETLRMIRAAGLIAVAARELVASGIVTAGAFCPHATLSALVAVLAGNLPALTHLAVCQARIEAPVLADPAVLDQLERAGIGLSASGDARETAFGANLLVFADGAARPAVGPPSPGVLVVNASERDLPAALLDSVDSLVVDDLRLVDRHRHREFVRLHDAGAGSAGQPPTSWREGLHHTGATWRRSRRIGADLLGVLIGARPRHTPDDVLLVELLGGRDVDVTLAGRLHLSAVRSGLGRLTDTV